MCMYSTLMVIDFPFARKTLEEGYVFYDVVRSIWALCVSSHQRAVIYVMKAEVHHIGIIFTSVMYAYTCVHIL